MKKKLVAALAALAAPANAQMGGSWLDSMVANEIGFTQQWNGYVTQGMNDLVASCMDHIQRTGTRCLAGYDASILSSANLGYDDYNAAMAANSAATDRALQNWSHAYRGAVPAVTGAGGYSYWVNPSATTSWVHADGTVVNNMYGYEPPSYGGAWYQLYPMWGQ